MRELIVMRILKPQPNQGRHRHSCDSRRSSAVRGRLRRGTIMIFVLGVLVLLALIGLLLIARTHGESKRVNYEAAASVEKAAMDDVVNLVRQTLRADIWGDPGASGPLALPLSGNRPAGGLLENNEPYDAPGPDDRWLASTVPYYPWENDLPQASRPYPLNIENQVLVWYRVSYLGTDILQSPSPFKYSANSRLGGPPPAYGDPKDPTGPSSLRNVYILQTPPPGMTNYLIPGSTTNVTIADARRWWEKNDPAAATGTYRFPYFDTNRDGIIVLYDTDGDGVPDSPISFVVPVKSSEPSAPKALYAAIRIVDHASMLNLNVASSLLQPGGAVNELTFDESGHVSGELASDRQRRGRRVTDLLLDETVHPEDSFAINNRTAGLAAYRWNAPSPPADPKRYDDEVVRRKLVGGHDSSDPNNPPYLLYGLQDEAALRHRGMLVPPDRTGARACAATDYCDTERALRGTLLWSRAALWNSANHTFTYDPGTPPRWNRLNSCLVTDPNDPLYAYYEGYDASATIKGWRSLLCDDDPLAIRRSMFTTVSHEVVPSPLGVTLDPNDPNGVVARLSANPVRIVSGPNPTLLQKMAWPVLNRVSYPNVPDHMRVLPIDINMSVNDPNDPNGTAVKDTYIRYMAAAMYLTLENVEDYQGFTLKDASGVQPWLTLNREYLAWQFAANMADYRDSDAEPTVIEWVYDPSTSASRYIFGIEKQPFFTEAYVRLYVPPLSSGSDPNDVDQWFFAVELYVPPLWKIPITSNSILYLHATGFQSPAPDPFPIRLADFYKPSAPLEHLTGLDGGTGAGQYYILCGGDWSAKPSPFDGPSEQLLYYYPNFRMATNGQGAVELAWSPFDDPTDPRNNPGYHVLDVIDPADTGGSLIGETSPEAGLAFRHWANRNDPDHPVAPGTAMRWSMLRSTQG
ncbi:MAG TPA: hypothetical protein VMV94_10630, partial [Phycisphaerae bacterium]|nr:hypothetical protein [Phycisphaerae bacterium]